MPLTIILQCLCRYSVRMALIDLQQPPQWFKKHQAADHMTAAEAQRFAGTDGEQGCEPLFRLIAVQRTVIQC